MEFKYKLSYFSLLFYFGKRTQGLKGLTGVVIEQLKVKVPSHGVEDCIKKAAQIWTTDLSRYPGFLGEEV